MECSVSEEGHFPLEIWYGTWKGCLGMTARIGESSSESESGFFVKDPHLLFFLLTGLLIILFRGVIGTLDDVFLEKRETFAI